MIESGGFIMKGSLSVSLFTAAAWLALAGCGGEGFTPPCECRSSEECGDGFVCDACTCIPRCDVSGECPSDTPNCNESTGLCEPPCPEYACPGDTPNCGGDGVCFGPCGSAEDCTNPDFPNCGPDGICFGPCSDHADCVHPDFPNCDPLTGLCAGPCPETACPPDLPNCGDDGLCFARCGDGSDCPSSMPNCNTVTGVCFGACTSSEDCIDPSAPNCDPATGLCQGPCPDVACPEGMVNCTADGVCFGPCTDPGDCVNPDFPNCGPDGVCFPPCEEDGDCLDPDRPNCDRTTGICFGPCASSEDCPDPDFPNCGEDGLCFGPCATSDDCLNSDYPNCNFETGVCFGPCAVNDDCLDPDFPNCGADGLCFGPCEVHDDCLNPSMPNCNSETGQCHAPCSTHDDCEDASRPNCDLDTASLTAGLCLPPCLDNDGCPSALYPNCDPTPGVCLPPCSADADCPEEAWKCDTASGLCFLPGCVTDTDCSPPSTVCEDWSCVPGCDEHGDCAADERCNLVGPDGVYHCEPRDCMSDADCTTPGTVCDTDGLVDPDGGGYCVSGCVSYYDCRQLGYDCDTGTGRCTAHDYGDIGVDCSSGCSSGFCLAAEGNLCTDFCCRQHDCPAGWGCRPHDDGTGGSRTVDVCVPLAPAQGERRYNEICHSAADCRSGVCSGNRCRETCCTDEDCDAPFVSGMYCAISGLPDVTACYVEPTVDNDPLGTLGCSTTGDPGDCRSDLCFSFYDPSTGCTANAQCTPARPTCWDISGDGVTDCVRDFCVDHCCSADDCVGSGTDIFACSKWLFGTSDYNICLLHEGPATLGEGAPCVANAECRSLVCSDSAHQCRRRCCTDEDCLSPLYPNCALEANHVYSTARMLNVCMP
jgi:hypothetical protein